jgi:hypothetical protein
MPWFWSSSSKTAENEYDDDEYTDDDEDDDDDEYTDGEEEGEEGEFAEEDHNVGVEEEERRLPVTDTDRQQQQKRPTAKNGPLVKEEDDEASVSSPESTIVDDHPTTSEYESFTSASSNGDDPAIASGFFPDAVSFDRGIRERVMSTVSFGEGLGDHEDEDMDIDSTEDRDKEAVDPIESMGTVVTNNENSKGDNDSGTSDEQELSVHETSLVEKQSLLMLAAEHDRVDILQAILTEDSPDRQQLLTEDIPPLHVSVSYGAVNATNCLLRMGADPSIRPCVAEIMRSQQQQASSPVSLKNIHRFDNLSAWELVFGAQDDNVDEHDNNSTSWFSFNISSSNLDDASTTEPSRSTATDMSTTTRRRRRARPSIQLPPSKKEGIRHAFTAEALRCIGSDEVKRLQQLIDANMPKDIDIGGKNLYAWAVDMNAVQCQALLREPDILLEMAGANAERGNNIVLQSRILNRDEEQGSLTQLANRLDELDALSKALSISLDGLAEEVSVCNGLLLMGGGASALAVHVRSLKDAKERKLAELHRLEDAWKNCQDELAYWVKQGGSDAMKIAETMMMLPDNSTLSRKKSFPSFDSNDKQQKEVQVKQLRAQIAASDHKICKLRASITDLSEVLARELAEVEKRGLTGGINMVRGLREEIREIEFAISEVSNQEATIRTKISLIQSMINTRDKPSPVSSPSRSSKEVGLVKVNGDSHGEPVTQNSVPSTSLNSSSEDQQVHMKESEVIATGHSTALTIRQQGGQGLFPFSLWEIIKRIIGYIDEPRRNTTTVMIV